MCYDVGKSAVGGRFLAIADQTEGNILFSTVLLTSVVSSVMGFVVAQYYSVDVLSSLSSSRTTVLDWGMKVCRLTR